MLFFFNLFIDKYRLLSEYQYGFRKNRTTTCIVMEMVEEISPAVENVECSVGIYIDLQKAFDTIVWHNRYSSLLAEKLLRK